MANKLPKNEVRNIPWQTRLSKRELKQVTTKMRSLEVRSRADYLVKVSSI